jgi:hypothetical protein
MSRPTTPADTGSDRAPEIPVPSDAEPADVAEQAEELPPDPDELDVADDDPERPASW